MKYVCIKDFPEDFFIVKDDAYKIGKTFNKYTYIIHVLESLECYDLKDYIITLAEWRDRQIEEILKQDI